MPLRAPQFPDAVAVVNTYLRAAMVAAGHPVDVKSTIPNPRPVELIRVSRTGGPVVLPVVDGAQLTFDCWAATPPAAMDLAQLARKLVQHAVGTVQSGSPIHAVEEFAGPQDLPDPVSNTPRVSFTLQVQIRGLAA